MNTFLLVLATIAAGVSIPWAIRADRADAHAIHNRGCVDCAAEDEWLGL